MPPPIWIAEMSLRCPSGSQRVRLVGPTSAKAIKHATNFKPPRGCYVAETSIVKRGAGAGLALDGAQRRRYRRRRRR